ncbi:hypothetical protein DV736_g1125, partial [Chaetothyriales sp. CBS 134916]
MAQHHTEESLLTRYLLPPSSLPTIIPLSTFFNYHKPGVSNSNSSISTTVNPATAEALKKFYRDLQFQRQIDVDTVRLNIERECRRGRVLKARLRKRIKAELRDGGQGVESANGRKRKHAVLGDSDEDQYEDEGNGNELVDTGEGAADCGEPYATLTDSREMALDAKFFGPNGAVLPTRSRRYHTTMSLLAAMESSIHDLEREIADLDGQSDKILSEMHETVGELSDLLYGKSSRTGEGAENGEDRAVEAEVVDALKEFTNAVNRTVKEAQLVR